MPHTVRPEVTLIARTEFLSDATADVMSGFRTDGGDGQALIEAAGRACYQSWSKPNPATATNAGYIKHIIDVAHFSVLEHATATFYITGVSRSFTHELVRHRHLSYSQLSQRYVPSGSAPVVEPEVIADDVQLHEIFSEAVRHTAAAYDRLLEGLKQVHAGESDATLRRKLSRQAARAVLPNATETKIVVTGNYRAWRDFIELRSTIHADTEIREIALMILNELRKEAPNVFADFMTFHESGTEVAVRVSR